ncbi:GDP-L-fucose synthase [Paenibacillus alkaliterrae]|uniref:GDP-L-fucose synthase family protein n=1 Tax=Paenibacillus alkaliterrae TaxID=320909 RepID=UPI001F1D9D6E|nr:GDP-L-fucose synthase [Paenibacillus alkaliterrae]MCF2940157.1 GDP-L-fucose synthase [Paenibacillus alkaliterrae]
MIILLTGAGGLVGRNLMEQRQLQGISGAWLTPSRQELNLLDYSSVCSYIEAHKPEMIIHAAGTVGGIQANMRQPVRFLLDNLDMGRNIVAAARRSGIRKLINLGSSCMYPKEAVNPLREEMILTGELEPTNEGYALAKITVARLCEYIFREDPAFQYKTLIPCNLYGRWDTFEPDRSHMIPAAIHKIHEAKTTGNPVVIWGEGGARREFMYAGDLALCLLRAVEQFDTLPSVMNVGIGSDYSINDYYRIIADIVGYDGAFNHDLSKPSGMRQKVVSIAKQISWGWSPRTTLEEGLLKTYAHYLERKEGIS